MMKPEDGIKRGPWDICHMAVVTTNGDMDLAVNALDVVVVVTTIPDRAGGEDGVIGLAGQQSVCSLAEAGMRISVIAPIKLHPCSKLTMRRWI